MLENGFKKCMLYMFLLRKTFLMWVFWLKKFGIFSIWFYIFPTNFNWHWLGSGGTQKMFFYVVKKLFNFVCKKQSRMLTKISVFLNMKFTFLSHFLLRKTPENVGFLIEKIQHFLYKNLCFYNAFLGTLLNKKYAFS